MFTLEVSALFQDPALLFCKLKAKSRQQRLMTTNGGVEKKHNHDFGPHGTENRLCRGTDGLG